MPLLHVCYPAKFGRSTANGTSVIREICLKIGVLASRHSRSSESTWIDPPPMTSY